MSERTPDSDYQPFQSLPRTRRLRNRAPSANTSPSAPRMDKLGTTAQPPSSTTACPRRRRCGLPRIALPLSTLVFLALVLGAAFLGYQFYLRDRAVPGVRVLGEEIGGMTRQQAEAYLRNKLGDPNELLARFGGEQIVLRAGAQVYRAWPWELGLRSDLRPALDAAFQIGHRGNWVLSLIEQGRALLFGADVNAAAAFDEATARAYVSLLAAQIDRPARDATYRLEGLELVETPAQKGQRLDGEEAFKRIQAYVVNPTTEITLPVEELEPHPADATAARAQIAKWLQAPLVLTFEDRAWAIDQAALAQMLILQPTSNADSSLTYQVALDRNALWAKVNELAREINQAPRDARFRFAEGRLTPIVTSQEGRTLDVEATVRAIEAQFKQMTTLLSGGSPENGFWKIGEENFGEHQAPGRSQAPAPPVPSPTDTRQRRPAGVSLLRAHTIPLSVRVIKPEIDMRDADHFGIRELIATGTSNFKGSIPNRIQNIKTATASFDGIVIPPGGTFSFIRYLSEIVEANGYEDAYVIFGDRTILGPGGGVCQVSTTMFRAAFWAGFPIVERWAHAYRVGYYEPPKGLDAAVFVPSADLKFINDTPHYILIESVFDPQKYTLAFNIYGTKPNREVKMTEPEVTNKVPHPPAKYIDDPTLPKGTIKQVDFAVDGEEVTLYRQIYVDGRLVSQQKFFSRYAPWQAVFLRGTR